VTSAENRPWPDDETLTAIVRQARPRGGDAYRDLHAAHRLLQDRLAGAALPPDAAGEITRRLTETAEMLAEFQAPESERFDGWRPDLPGRGEPLLPAYVIEEENDRIIRGHVTFTRFYLGGNGAAHGGALPLLFDDVLGKVVNFHHSEGVARTAYLTVNYRRIVPLGALLRFDATVDRIDGRKRWGSARLVDAEQNVLCDAEGLFLKLRPGQP
jgi:acyl-coenzyme A thioesterase PaaI-like protein